MELNCPICKTANAQVTGHRTRDASVVNCPQCGQYNISETAVVNLRRVDEESRWKISAWINEFGVEMISSADVDQALASVMPSLHHRSDRMLRWIVEEFPAGKTFTLNDLGNWKSYENDPNSNLLMIGGFVASSRLVPIGWNKSISEMEFMVTEVLNKELGLLSVEGKHIFQISPKGLLYLEGRRNSESAMAFCAMWFSPEVLPLWETVIDPAVRAAGYEPLRIDAKQHNGKIDDEIMASIRAARFVISDFTGNRGGVYYEAGFAHGLGLPVIFMCRVGDELHFDIRQYNCIFWKPDELDDARERLKNRILATLGQGPLSLK